MVLSIAKRAGVLRPKDVRARGIPNSVVARLVASGRLQRVGRGLYVVPGAKAATEHHTLAEAARRVPHGVVCLLSALQFHGLTTQAPFEVWLAVDHKARLPKVDAPSVRVVRFSGHALTAGVDEHKVENVPVRIYSAAKTIADCFKYRNKIGLDVALEALRDYLRGRGAKVTELLKFARICRVERVMRPYIEALS